VPDKSSLTGRVRLIGLISSVVAVVAIGLTVLTGNQNLGRNQTITQSQQIFLLFAAAALFVVQAVLYLIFRHRHKRTIARPPRRPNENM
jgi:ABC-type nickel/cobalt efflux system permease component RcnA